MEAPEFKAALFGGSGEAGFQVNISCEAACKIVDKVFNLAKLQIGGVGATFCWFPYQCLDMELYMKLDEGVSCCTILICEPGLRLSKGFNSAG